MENLPPEIMLNIFEYLNEIDIFNCSVALLGTRNEEFVTQTCLKDQLKILASLDVNLNKSIKNCGWSQECKDVKLIVRIHKEFKPKLPSMYLLILQKN